jgi:hypothetical protein
MGHLHIGFSFPGIIFLTVIEPFNKVCNVCFLHVMYISVIGIERFDLSYLPCPSLRIYDPESFPLHILPLVCQPF